MMSAQQHLRTAFGQECSQAPKPLRDDRVLPMEKTNTPADGGKCGYLQQIGLLQCVDDCSPPLQQTDKSRLSAADRAFAVFIADNPTPTQQKAERAYLQQIGLLLCSLQTTPLQHNRKQNAPICSR